jgi:glyoxylase-like metal-dependent hydrolase (beta-lactamase superfamily II)
MAKDTNAPIFPNVTIHAVPEYSSGPTRRRLRAAKRIQAVFPGWKNIKQFEGDREVVPGVKAIATNGHTFGHTSYQITGSRQPIVLGDVITSRRCSCATRAGMRR